MQISLKWLNELVTIQTVNLTNLINKLTLGGFEVEEILEVEIDNEKQIALEISATANRSDSLSIYGFSLEIAALLNEPPNVSQYSTKMFSWAKKIDCFSQNTLQNNDCSEFIALTVENVNNFTSPKWLKQKLLASGITPKNNLNDFQNYIILETGYPFEFYDLEKIYLDSRSSKFNLNLMLVKNFKNLNNFFDDTNTISNFNKQILLLKANDLAISIAGIVPNKNFICSNTTKSLLIEGSIFNPTTIRQQSRKLGLRTERSSRYEKSVKNTNLLEGLYRLVSLLRIQNPNLVVTLHTSFRSSKQVMQTISLNYEKVKKVLGPIRKTSNNHYNYILPQNITDSLTRLQFKVKYDEKNMIWNVDVPSLRNDDIVLDIDLIEEIGRIYGFDNFLMRLPKIEKIGTEDFNYQIRKKVTSCLLNLGLTELVQYSLVSKKLYLNNEIKLINPLTKDYSNLRSSLLPSLLKIVKENSKNNKSILEGFEYGHVFSGNTVEKLEEKEHVAGILGGIKTKSSWSNKSKFLNWFEAKGRMEQLFQKLNLRIIWKSYLPLNEKEILHPYCTGEIFLNNGNRLGIFGQIHPVIAKRLAISVDFYLFEFDFELIQSTIQQNKLTVYREYPVYPKIVKDLSFIVSNKISYNDITRILYLNGSKLLQTITLLDEYKEKEVPKNHTSLCLQFIFQSNKTTLQSKKIDTIIENMKLILITKFNAILRE